MIENNMPFSNDYPIWLAPAKLNLFLHITSQRGDGYHNLQTLFQLLDYGDKLQFIPREDNQFIAQYQIAGLSDKDDLIVRAAKSLYQYAVNKKLILDNQHYGVSIYLSKILPMGGGLGGGSSDAATTLKALNTLWDRNLSNAILSEIGLKLGADVPIFVLGKSCWAEGVGELLSPFSVAPSYYFIIIPKVHISTAKLFSDPDLKRDCKKIDRMSFMQKNLIKTENVFEPLIRKNYPQIESAFESLGKFATPRLTGTGACLFIALESEQQCREINAQLSSQFSTFYAKGV